MTNFFWSMVGVTPIVTLPITPASAAVKPAFTWLETITVPSQPLLFCSPNTDLRLFTLTLWLWVRCWDRDEIKTFETTPRDQDIRDWNYNPDKHCWQHWQYNIPLAAVFPVRRRCPHEQQHTTDTGTLPLVVHPVPSNSTHHYYILQLQHSKC